VLRFLTRVTPAGIEMTLTHSCRLVNCHV